MPEAVATRWMVISERVRVPVLSVQITEAEPSVSTDDRRFTTARRLAMRCTPSASTTDRIAGRPSGTAATASATPSSRTVTTSCRLLMSATRNSVAITTTATTTMPMPSIRPRRPTSRCSGVRSSTTASSMEAMPPISVSIPVAVTMPPPVPWPIEVPLNTIELRSASAVSAGSAAVPLATGALSPVSEASCTLRAAAWNSRASAPTASPSASSSTSPGTSSRLAMRWTTPSRSTDEVTWVIFASAATALEALASCAKPSTALSSTITAITRASTGQPVAPSAHQATDEIAIATISRATSGSRNWARKCCQAGTGGVAARAFAPYRRSRRVASAVSSPASGLVRSLSARSSAVAAHGAGWGGSWASIREPYAACRSVGMLPDKNPPVSTPVRHRAVSMVQLHGRPTVRFNGVNVQVVNGTGNTETSSNFGASVSGGT